MEALLARVESTLMKQRALVTWKQLAEAGIADYDVSRLVERRVLDRLRPAVYGMVGAPDSWERGLQSALLCVGDDALASHLTSGRLWEYACWLDDWYEILVTHDRRPRLQGVRVHRTTLIDDSDRSERNGIPCTSFERTLCDCTTTLSEFRLGRILDDGLRRKVASLSALRDCAERLDSGPGRRMSVIRSLLAVRDKDFNPGGSASELRVLEIVRAAGLPEPQQQYIVHVRGRTYVLDYAWPEFKVFAEWYGLPFHIGASRVAHDNARVTAMARIGWLPAIFTDGTPDYEIRDAIAEALAQHGFGR
jgi:hypothetical protein